MDGAEGVEVAVDPDCLECSCASLRLTIPASIAPMTGKGSEEGKGTSKWRKSLVIAEGKMSLSRVAESLYTSMIERMKREGKSMVRPSSTDSKNQARDSMIEL